MEMGAKMEDAWVYYNLTGSKHGDRRWDVWIVAL